MGIFGKPEILWLWTIPPRNKLKLHVAESIMMEPLSFYAFSALSLTGLVGLSFINVTKAKSAEGMYDSDWVMKFWVPISYAGLTTGTIVMGMMLGLAIGLTPWAFSNNDVQELVKLLFKMSFLVLFLLYPRTVPTISANLDESKTIRHNKTRAKGICYCRNFLLHRPDGCNLVY